MITGQVRVDISVLNKESIYLGFYEEMVWRVM